MSKKTNTSKKVNKPTKKKSAKIGRPKITTKDLPDNWKEIIGDMCAQGKAKEQIFRELCVSGKGKKVKFNWETYRKLKDREEEFNATIQVGDMLCYGWWLDAGQAGIHRKVFQTGCWYANMKNRFGWRDKQEVTGSVTHEHFLGEAIIKSKGRDDGE